MAYLCHHGIKGQKWGVKNGPPYPLKRITTKTSAKEQNDIYSTLSLDARKKLMGYDKDSEKTPDDHFTTDEQLAKDTLKTFMAKYGSTPVSSFTIWDEGDGDVDLSVMTRDGYQGKGYASAVTKKGMDWIENNKNIKTAYWDVRIDNIASINLAKKYGFKKMPGTNKARPEWTSYLKEFKR